MKKTVTVLLALVMLLSLLTGCGTSAPKDTMVMSPMAAPEAAMKEEFAEEFAMDAGVANGMLTESTATASTAVPENRKWIITMDMNAETEDLDAMLAALDEKITAMGGYVEGQNIYNGSSYSDRRWRNANLTVRIPAEDVDSFTEAVSGISNVVRSNKNLEDITLTYVSTESRVKALQTEEARLLELMEQAETMSDLLEIEGRLTDVRYELENYTSRLRTFDNQVNFATIYLYIEEVQEYTPAAERTVWQRISEGFVSNLKNLGEGFVDVLVWLLAGLPYIVVFGAVIAVIIVVIRKCKKRKAAKKAQKQKEE